MKGNFGARVLSPGLVEFRLWAPDASHVRLCIQDGRSLAMGRDELDVYSISISCQSGVKYKYEIDHSAQVPDPASRAQATDVHSESVVVDPEFNWLNSDWRGRPWHEAVIYELHVGALGGFEGVAEHLPRLKRLGVTAIELMPIAAFPGRHNWGYDGVLPYAPDAAYGTPEQLRRLVDDAHGYGIQVFLDVVYNHFGPDGNYISSYAKQFFDETVHTPWGGAINFRLQAVRRFFIENALYWLSDYRFDGLRFDAVHAIDDNKFLFEMADEIRQTFPDRHVHLILENENNEPNLLCGDEFQPKYNAQWSDDWHHCLHVLLTGEDEGYYADFQAPSRQLARCLSEGFAYQGDALKHASGKARGGVSVHLPPSAFVICLQNHDQIGNRALGERLTTLAHPDALRAAMVLLLMTPQIPMLFMGEEWGEQNPFLFFTDHSDELAVAVREGRRREFSHFKAFSQPETRAEIPDPNAVSTFTESVPHLPLAPTKIQAAYLDLVQSCLALRALHIAPRIPRMKSGGAVALSDASVRAEWYFGTAGRLTIAANFGLEPVPCVSGNGKLSISSVTQVHFKDLLPPRSAFVWLAHDE